MHLHKKIERKAIQFLRKTIVPAAKRVGADLMEFATPQIEEAVSGMKVFKSMASSVGRQTLKKQLGSGCKKRSASLVSPTKTAKQTGWSRRDT